MLCDWPLGQAVHSVCPALGETLPGGQRIHVSAPTSEKEPAGQSRHMKLLLEKLPASQTRHEAAAEAETAPLVQFMQARPPAPGW